MYSYQQQFMMTVWWCVCKGEPVHGWAGGWGRVIYDAVGVSNAHVRIIFQIRACHTNNYANHFKYLEKKD
jgi:hypothetical protein